jgi:putative DNA primase/helicase
MKQDFFEFKPTFKLAIFGNNKPGLTSVDEAIRRRIHMLPFNATFSDAQKDPALPEKLKAEWPGILRWCIEGCLKWQGERLTPPAAVIEATKDYFAAEDHLTAWIEESCTLAPDAWETTERLFSAWKSWAANAGIAAGDQGSLKQAIQKNLGEKVKPCQRRDFGKVKKALAGIALIKEDRPSSQFSEDDRR